MRQSWSGLLAGGLALTLWATPALAWDTNVCLPDGHGGYRLVVPGTHEEWERLRGKPGAIEVEKGKPCPEKKKHQPQATNTPAGSPPSTSTTAPTSSSVPVQGSPASVTTSTPSSSTAPTATPSPPAPSASTAVPQTSPVLPTSPSTPSVPSQQGSGPDQTVIWVCLQRPPSQESPTGRAMFPIKRDESGRYLDQWVTFDARGYPVEGPCPASMSTPTGTATSVTPRAPSTPTPIATPTTTTIPVETPLGTASSPSPEPETAIGEPLCIKMLETGEVVDCSYDDEHEQEAPALTVEPEPDAAPEVEDFTTRPETSGPGRG